MRVSAIKAGNVWHVAEIDKKLWIQDMRSQKLPKKMRGIFIYVQELAGMGKRTGFSETRCLTIHQTENLIKRLQLAINEAKEIEQLEPQYHNRIGNRIKE